MNNVLDAHILTLLDEVWILCTKLFEDHVRPTDASETSVALLRSTLAAEEKLRGPARRLRLLVMKDQTASSA